MLARGRVGDDYSTTDCLRIARGRDASTSSATTLRARFATSSAMAGGGGGDRAGRVERDTSSHVLGSRQRSTILRHLHVLRKYDQLPASPRKSSSENLHVWTEGCGTRRSRSTFCGILALLP